MIVRIQRFKLCFLFILHLDGEVRMNCPSWSMSALLPTFNGQSSRPWSILVC